MKKKKKKKNKNDFVVAGVLFFFGRNVLYLCWSAEIIEWMASYLFALKVHWMRTEFGADVVDDKRKSAVSYYDSVMTSNTSTGDPHCIGRITIIGFIT
jgi:hypothetical protein